MSSAPPFATGSSEDTGTAGDGATSTLTSLFAPGSIAVVGASPDLRKPGGRCLAYLSQVGYPGSVYPINPRYEEIAGANHFTVVDPLGDAESAMTKRVVELAKQTAALQL